MTNAQIIFSNRVFLMEQGVIKGIPGTSILWKDEDGERELLIPEEIKTFEAWKHEGYIVQKGEHAVAKFQIWMPRKNKKVAQAEAGEEESAEDAEMKARGFYKKVAFFFTMGQVKPIKGKEG